MNFSARRILIIGAALTALHASPANARDLGIDLETLLKGLSTHASAAGAPLKMKKVGCRENKKPGDPTQKIMSCSHLLGPGKLIITNADPAGPLLDVSTQRWEAGANGPAANMMSWLASTLAGGAPADHMANANSAVEKAAKNKTSATEIGPTAFYVMDFGSSMVISVSPK